MSDEPEPSAPPLPAPFQLSLSAPAPYTNQVHLMLCDAGLRLTFHEVGNGVTAVRCATLVSLETSRRLLEQLSQMLGQLTPEGGARGLN